MSRRDEVTAWLGRAASGLAGTGPTDGDDDLEPLRAMLDGVDVVGFADTTHGTREFFDVRHRMLRFLVERMGFRNLFLEAGHSAVRAVDDYIAGGRGDKSAALSGLGFAMWDVEEFSRVLDWLRRHNDTVPDEDRVRLHGADIWNTRASRDAILRYLRDTAPEATAPAERLFEDVAHSEAEGPLLASARMDVRSLRRIRELSAWFQENGRSFAGRSSPAAFDATCRHLQVVSQWIRANVGDGLEAEASRAPGMDNYARSRYMAQNVFQVLEDDPHRKSVIWSHLFHLGDTFTDPSRGVLPNMGHLLRRRLGDRYYVFGLEFDRGTYLAREWPPGRRLGGFETVTLPPSPEESLPGYLARIGGPALMLDLRGRSAGPAAEDWLTTPRKIHTVSWCHRESPWIYTDLAVGSACDGVVFVENTTATTPTDGARANLSRGDYH